MKTIDAAVAALQTVLLEHRDLSESETYQDLAIDLAVVRADGTDEKAVREMLTHGGDLVLRIQENGNDSRSTDRAGQAIDACLNELRGPGVQLMADALLAIFAAADAGAMTDDIQVNGRRTFSIDAMVDAETLARKVLEAAERIAGA